MVIAFALTAWADCPTGPANNAALQRQVESAFFSFVELDDAGFAAYREQAVQSVFCLDELIHPHLAAEFLRLEGVRAFTAREEGFAADAFRSALTLEPSHTLPTTLAPPGGPLHTLYAQSASRPVVPWRLPEGPFRGYVNGIPSTTSPNGIAVVQLVMPDGTLPFSGVVTGPDELPMGLIRQLQATQPVEPIDPVLPPPPPPPDAPPKRGRTPLAVASTGMAVIAASLFAGSVVSRTRYDAAPTSTRRVLTNGLFIGSATFGAGAVGVGIATFTTAGR